MIEILITTDKEIKESPLCYGECDYFIDSDHPSGFVCVYKRYRNRPVSLETLNRDFNVLKEALARDGIKLLNLTISHGFK